MPRIFRLLHRFEELGLSLTFLGLALVAAVQVFFRYALDISFAWFEELSRFIGVFATFLGASLGVRQGAHFSMDLLVNAVRPPLRRALQIFTGALCGSFLLILAYYGLRLVLRSYGFETTSPVLQIPMYLTYLPIPLFLALMALRFFLAAGQALRGGPRP
jgi:C4-dicarboxylate transporter, DctQ subunit